MTKPLVALVGRPNVGKSTLFNKLVGGRLAVVDDTPGTTRDRLQAAVEWGGRTFLVVDTGGIEVLEGQRQGMRNVAPLSTASEPFLAEIRAQAEMAINAADVLVLVVDATVGLTSADEQVAELLRRRERRNGPLPPVLIAANKVDSVEREEGVYEFYAMGLGEVIALSAMHGTGSGDLLDAIVRELPPGETEPEEEDDAVKIAIVGRPNVGKSSLLNRLVGYERVIVSPVAGTTRDAVDTRITVGEQEVTLIDTAGIRRRGKIDPGLEKYSVLRALKAVGRADVALLLIDAVEGVTAQDAHIAGFVLDEMKSVIVVINKWDLLKAQRAEALRNDAEPPQTIEEFGAKVREELQFLSFVPVLFISAKTGLGVEHVLPEALEVVDNRMKRIPTGELNRIVRDAVLKHPPAAHGGRSLRVYYVTQAGVDPPTFLFFVNDPKLMHFSYERYLENCLRAEYSFSGSPIRISVRKRRRDME